VKSTAAQTPSRTSLGTLGDGQARALLNAPGSETLKGKRDRAILSVLLYHGLRREELCTLKVRDIHPRRGVLHLRVHGKGGKVRYLPLHPGTAELVTDYLEAAGHGGETAAALFRPVKNNTGGTVEGAITADGIYKMVQRAASLRRMVVPESSRPSKSFRQASTWARVTVRNSSGRPIPTNPMNSWMSIR
jgi:integrase